jgi:CheY-like chemotaxis protein
LTRPTILIVDDDEGFRDALAEIFKDEGYEVAMSSNGRQAIELLLGGLRPLAILLDVMMPVMNGADFRAAQLRMAEVRAIPVAVLSASGISRKEITAKFGAVEYIPKPMSAQTVLTFIERCRPPRTAGRDKQDP